MEINRDKPSEEKARYFKGFNKRSETEHNRTKSAKGKK